MTSQLINIGLETLVSICILALALLAIAEPISRMRAVNKSLKQAHLFRARQDKLSKIIGGDK